MKRKDIKSNCPINYSLESFGDQWSLLILRDIALFGKHTFKEFMESSERITTSELTNKLESLEKSGILLKTSHPEDQRRVIYNLTEKGLDLVPILLELMEWGTKYDVNSTGHRKKDLIEKIRKEQSEVGKKARAIVEKGSYIFNPEDYSSI